MPKALVLMKKYLEFFYTEMNTIENLIFKAFKLSDTAVFNWY